MPLGGWPCDNFCHAQNPLNWYNLVVPKLSTLLKSCLWHQKLYNLVFYLYNSKYIIFTVNFRETIAPMIISQNAGIDFGWTSSSEILFSCISMDINGFWVREKLSHGRAPRGTFCDRKFSIFNIFHCGWKCLKRIFIGFRKRHDTSNNSKNPWNGISFSKNYAFNFVQHFKIILGHPHPEIRDHHPRIRLGTNPRPPILNIKKFAFFLPRCPDSTIYLHRLVSRLNTT